MKRFFLFFILAVTAAAQTAKPRVDLYAQIGTQLASGQQLTAAQLRAVINDVVASAYNAQTDGAPATAANLAAHLSNTSNPHSVTKAQVGLGSVDNTSDLAKPISTATQAALDAKAAASHSHSNATQGAAGFMSAADKTKLDGIEAGATADPTAAEIEAAYNSQVPIATQAEAEAGSGTSPLRWTPARLKQAILALAPSGGAILWGGIGGTLANQSDLTAALAAKVPTSRTVAGKALSADITLAKADVGLSNVDNTSDASKPISTATQAALDAKAAATHTHLQEFGFILGDTTTVLPVVTSPARLMGKGGTIVGWYIRGDIAGTGTVDIERASAGGSFSSITGAGAKPALSASIYAASSSMAGWTQLAFSAGDSFRARVTGTPSTLTQVTVTIVYQ